MGTACYVWVGLNLVFLIMNWKAKCYFMLVTRQAMYYNVTLRRVRSTVVAVGMQ